MKRVVLLLSILVFAAASPARVWCEAACLAPVDTSDHESHCSVGGAADDGIAMSGTTVDECPVPEAARPSTGKFELASLRISHVPTCFASGPASPRPLARSYACGPVYLLTPPLRI